MSAEIIGFPVRRVSAPEWREVAGDVIVLPVVRVERSDDDNDPAVYSCRCPRFKPDLAALLEP